jgi:hypothetical protein
VQIGDGLHGRGRVMIDDHRISWSLPPASFHILEGADGQVVPSWLIMKSIWHTTMSLAAFSHVVRNDVLGYRS